MGRFARGLAVASLSSFGASAAIGLLLLSSVARGQTSGPLRVSEVNPRYFTDDRGKAIYLTGSHTWNSWQDWPQGHQALDYPAYLDFLVEKGHNFLKLRVWEGIDTSPLPFARPGPGTALDGNPRFHLTQYNQEFFNRLRQRAQSARDRGIFVAVLLFQWREPHEPVTNPFFQFTNSPFHPGNNVNGINGDTNADGRGEELHTLGNGAVLAIQEAYVRRVVDTVNDLDNILYEISNESPLESEAWAHRMIQVIRSHEAGRKRHPIVLSAFIPGDDESRLLNSPAEAISPGPTGFLEDSPAIGTTKIVLSDPDHYGYPFFMGTQEWVWKTFTRGGHPIPLDVLPDSVPGYDSGGYAHRANQSELDAMRSAMGQTRAFAEKIDLLNMFPRSDLTSTEYALAKVGQEYLVYQPFDGALTLDLSGAPGSYVVQWFNPSSGVATAGGSVTGGTTRTLQPPFSGDAVLHLLRSGSPPPSPPSKPTNLRITR